MSDSMVGERLEYRRLGLDGRMTMGDVNLKATELGDKRRRL